MPFPERKKHNSTGKRPRTSGVHSRMPSVTAKFFRNGSVKIIKINDRSPSAKC